MHANLSVKEEGAPIGWELAWNRRGGAGRYLCLAMASLAEKVFVLNQ